MGKWMVVIAGPNGAGKSKFCENFEKEGLIKNAFDADKFALNYSKENKIKFDFGLIESQKEYQRLKESHLKSGKNFSYQSNFCGHHEFSTPWDFKQKGFKTGLIFIAVSNEEISKERVQCRVIKNGHDVSESTIKRRFEQSFKDLDMFYKHYDLVELYDNSINNSPITKLLRIEKGELAYVTPNLPEYLKERIPKICDEYYLYHTGKKEVGKTM
jgi:predicted ABC-type ATPase